MAYIPSLVATHCEPRCEDGAIILDLFRIADMLMYIGIVGYAMWVLINYYKSYKHAPSGRRGLLPAHVALISLSYMVALTQIVYENYRRLGHAYTNHIPINAFIFATGLIALNFVLGYEKRVVGIRRKVRVEEDFVIDTGVKEEAAMQRRRKDDPR